MTFLKTKKKLTTFKTTKRYFKSKHCFEISNNQAMTRYAI